jgi:hypothetical protein
MLQKIFIISFCFMPMLPSCSIAQEIDGDQIYTVLPKDAITAILEPVLVSGEQADSIMNDQEQVLGIIGPGGTPVAYSTWHLDQHEIVNSIVDGLPLAVTW